MWFRRNLWNWRLPIVYGEKKLTKDLP
jgi:hypothetical protein